MKKGLIVLGMIAAVLLFVSGNAQATVLGLELALPDIFSRGTHTYVFNSGTGLGLFTATGTPIDITFDGSTYIPITGGTYSVSFYTDMWGNFAGGIDGQDDLVITGNFNYDGKSYNNKLVVGEVTNSGWEGIGYNQFDFIFISSADGALHSFYEAYGYDNKGGDVMFSYDNEVHFDNNPNSPENGNNFPF